MKYLKLFLFVPAMFILTTCNDDNPVSPVEDVKVRDIDNNDYQTVKIGDQWWMAENLRVTRYRNGDAIPTNIGNDQWENTISGAYAIYPHDKVDGINSDAEMVAAYGKLYNWYAVDDSRGLCPAGWHVPSDDEWKQLEMYLGMSEQDVNLTGYRGSPVGGKLKSIQTEPDPHPRWSSPNTEANNESGFSGLPSGRRKDDGGYIVIGYNGGWWSSSKDGTYLAWSRSLRYHYDGSSVTRATHNKNYGFSIRCLRD